MLSHDNARSGGQPDTILSPANASSMGLLWSFQTGAGLSASPTVAGGTVYVGSWDGYEYALDATTGAQKWRTSLGITSVASCVPPSAGVSSTATVQNGVVYVGGGDSYWYALDANTGAVLWRLFTGDNSAAGGYYNWSSPLLYNGFAYIGIASFGDCPLVPGKLLKVDLTSHAIVASFTLVPAGTVGGGIWTSPALDTASNTIFVSTGTCIDMATQPYCQAVVALDATTLSLKSVWQIPPANEPFDPDWGVTPIIYPDGTGRTLVSSINKNGILYAFNDSNLTAGPVWMQQFAAPGPSPQGGTGSVASGAFGQATLYAAGANTTIGGVAYGGSVRAVSPATGAYLWEHGTPGIVMAGLAYFNGLIAVGQGSTLQVLNATTGATLFSYTTGNLIYSSPTVSNGVLYAGSQDGKVYAFSAASGPPQPGPTNYASVVQSTSGLQHYYRLGEASGPTAQDSKGTANGTYTGTVNYGVPGALAGDPSTAVKFDGSTGYVAVPNGSSTFTGGQATIEGWVMLPPTPPTHGMLFGVRNDTNADFYLLQLAGTNTLEARFRNSGGTATSLTSTAITPGLWHHLALTYNGSTLTLYVDGVANNSAAASGSITASTLDFRIGKDAVYGFATSATVDEVAAYNTGLTAAQISNHFTGTVSGTATPTPTVAATATPGSGSSYFSTISGTTGLQDYYRLDQASGTVATDSTGARNGVINGTVTDNLAGALTGDPDAAMAFDGSTGYVAAANGSAALTGGSISIEGWAKLPNAPANHGFLFGVRNDTNADFYLLQLAGTNTLEARFRNSGGTATTAHQHRTHAWRVALPGLHLQWISHLLVRRRRAE